EIILPEPDPSFNAWMDALPDEEKPPQGQRGHDDKPAGDGMSNLLKYALGLKPLTPSGQENPRVVAFSGEALAVEIARAKSTTAVIGLEASTDLESWEPVDFSVEWQEDVGEARERVHLVIDVPEDGAYFLRLRVELD